VGICRSRSKRRQSRVLIEDLNPQPLGQANDSHLEVAAGMKDSVRGQFTHQERQVATLEPPILQHGDREASRSVNLDGLWLEGLPGVLVCDFASAGLPTSDETPGIPGRQVQTP